MKTVQRTLLATVLLLPTGTVAEGDESARAEPEENTCIQCHGNPELWEGDTLRLYVTVKNLATDIHWAKGIRCQDCHGGDDTSFDVREAHAEENGFHTLKSAGDIPGFCGRCHEEGRFEATLAGVDEAKKMAAGLEKLKKQITVAETKLDEAERLGMEVRKPRFQLLESRDALINARSLVHSFSVEAMQDTLNTGSEVALNVEKDARKALQEYTWRRIWLACSLVPILIVVGLHRMAFNTDVLGKCQPDRTSTWIEHGRRSLWRERRETSR